MGGYPRGQPLASYDPARDVRGRTGSPEDAWPSISDYASQSLWHREDKKQLGSRSGGPCVGNTIAGNVAWLGLARD